MSGEAMGGYFELQLPAPGASLYPRTHRFESARAAFCALLRAAPPARVYVPKLICDSMLAPLRVAGIPLEFYDLTADLDVADGVVLGKGDWLLHVNYFGLCDEIQARLLRRFPPAQLVFDHAQAFYSPPRECLATVYSPRKFFGLPDGGLLATGIAVTALDADEEASVARSKHLLVRLARSAEAGYAEFRRAEESLEDFASRAMSALTARLFDGSDQERARQLRNENFATLHALLGPHNALRLDPSRTDGPMCYPWRAATPGLRAQLVARRIFVPTYWPEVRARVAPGSVEDGWMSNVHALPCDQRYRPEQMRRLADICLALAGRQEEIH